jgi:hypothetical protein
VGGQLFEINERLGMTVISRASADVWVRNSVTGLWDFDYRIPLPVDDINLNDGYFHHDGTYTLTAGVFAVAQNQNVLVQCPRVLLHCDALGVVLRRHELAEHWTFLSRHTIEESLLLHPAILPMQDGDDVADHPPFF